jgi:hypothetical protein
VREVEDLRGEGDAHQSPRCSSGWHGRAVPARPAKGCLGKSSPSTHREHHTLALPPVSTHETQAPEQAQQAPQALAQRGTASGVLGGGRSWGETPPRSPQRGGGRWFHLVEMKEGAEESISPKVAAAKTTGEARRQRRWSSCCQGARGKREESEGLGWVGRPTQTRAGLA